ncbi:MAG: hypothetical protein JWN04_6421 [Myxococcaceae bacterium]|nr:hypothetical protein [Myxococcaceae bacterium]
MISIRVAQSLAASFVCVWIASCDDAVKDATHHSGSSVKTVVASGALQDRRARSPRSRAWSSRTSSTWNFRWVRKGSS